MNWDKIKANWPDLSVDFRKQFDRFSDTEMEHLSGSRDILVEKVQKKYGFSSGVAEEALERWRQSLEPDSEIPTSTSGAPTY